MIAEELVRLSIQRDIFNKDFPPEGDFYNAAIEILKKLRHVSSNLLSANDPVALRQVLLAGIERIELTSEGDFQIYGSSPNYKGWYPGRELFELLLIRFSIEKKFYTIPFNRKRSM